MTRNSIIYTKVKTRYICGMNEFCPSRVLLVIYKGIHTSLYFLKKNLLIVDILVKHVDAFLNVTSKTSEQLLVYITAAEAYF